MKFFCVNFKAAFILIFTSACGSDGARIIDPPNTESIDVTGNWIGPCKMLDASELPQTQTIYSNNRINISESTITAAPVIFNDSDCTTISSIPYQYSGFAEGTYALGASFTTETGLSAHPITIQVTGSDETIENIVTVTNGILYFGFDLVDGQDRSDASLPSTFDLDNGYQRP